MSFCVFLILLDIVDWFYLCYFFLVLLSIKFLNNNMGFLEVFIFLIDVKISDIIVYCSLEYFNVININKL